ncbi:hypothetical protein [Accumulibacter sp.]|uniref:hypothetical protein n=1 Tax=Accumulibacter sp. TaxID=2053492 RepID=UPI0025E7D63D|nr:hypothetical protein [Accumulibacter sp.]MCM8625674.1 hypothetical protein [Accumulibacter sp.]
MKKVILGSVLAIAAVTSFSVNAAAVSVCSGGSAANPTYTFTAGTSFVKVAFTPKCSANVFLVGNEQGPTLFTVGSGSAKGRNRFAGSSVGGSVANIAPCTGGANDTCNATDATAAEAAAPTT